MRMIRRAMAFRVHQPSAMIRALFNAAVEFYAATAGRLLEPDRLPPADHRPWPLPREPWVMAQTWSTLLFAHWPVPKGALQRLLPSSIEVDAFDGSAWLGITPFEVRGLRLRGLPPVPFVSTFPEINVRTYATIDGKPGVVFFSLDAGSALAVAVARRWYVLPYFRATMAITRTPDGRIRFRSRRVDRGAPAAEFSAEYQPVDEVAPAVPGSLEWWLTERYCLYALDSRGGLYRAEIHHRPWPLQPAEVSIRRNTMTAWLGLRLTDQPVLAHFAATLDVKVWPPRAVARHRKLQDAA